MSYEVYWINALQCRSQQLVDGSIVEQFSNSREVSGIQERGFLLRERATLRRESVRHQPKNCCTAPDLQIRRSDRL